MRSRAPRRPVKLDVWEGDTVLGTVTANWYRWDLANTGKGNWQHAFRFLFLTQTDVSTGRLVRVTFAGTRRAIHGSPKTVQCRD